MAVSEAEKRIYVMSNFFASVFIHENMPHIEMGERSNNITLADVQGLYRKIDSNFTNFFNMAQKKQHEGMQLCCTSGKWVQPLL